MDYVVIEDHIIFFYHFLPGLSNKTSLKNNRLNSVKKRAWPPKTGSKVTARCD